MGTVANIWRHPIKSHGREALPKTTLTTGQTMPWDRRWAVTHTRSKFDAAAPAWVMCRNFMIGALTEKLAGIWAALDEESGQITLRHPDIGTISFRPDDPDAQARFVAWVRPLSEGASDQPTGIAHVPDRGMTDTDYASVSIMNHASHDAVCARLPVPIAHERWRGNIWLAGLEPWAEFDWIGRDVAIGGAVLSVRERIGRCMHTASNPETGKRDADTLGTLQENWGHKDFGVYATVKSGGTIAVGDTIKVL